MCGYWRIGAPRCCFVVAATCLLCQNGTSFCVDRRRNGDIVFLQNVVSASGPSTAAGGAGGPPVAASSAAATPAKVVLQKGRIVTVDESKLDEATTVLTSKYVARACSRRAWFSLESPLLQVSTRSTWRLRALQAFAQESGWHFCCSTRYNSLAFS